MKKIIRIFMVLAMIFCILPLSVHAEEAGETSEILDAKFKAGTKLETFVNYIIKNGGRQNDKYFLYKKDGAIDLYIFYNTTTNQMDMHMMDHKTDGTYDQMDILYSAETLAVSRCAALLRLSSSNNLGVFEDNFSVADYMLTNVEDFARSEKGTTSRADRAAANALLRKTVTQLDSYVASMKSKTGVSGLEELGFFALHSGDQLRAFVERLYNLCLNRAPDESGLSYWVKKLYKQEVTASECVRGFFMSAEMAARHLTDQQFVEICYKVMLGRNADSGGLKYWVERLENGVSWMFILKGFTDSTEFSYICRDYGVSKGRLLVSEPRDVNYGITSFVARCYTKCLGRKFDVSGLNNWCKKILEAASQKQEAIRVASDGFFHSAEFINRKTSNELYVTILYATFLDRKPDTNGFNVWVSKLKAGMSRDTVLRGFANSAEFAKLMASYGIH